MTQRPYGIHSVAGFLAALSWMLFWDIWAVGVSHAGQIHIPVETRATFFGIVDSMVFEVHYGGADTALFEDWKITTQMAGAFRRISGSSDDPQYPAFASRLTNGKDETLHFIYRFPGGGALTDKALESSFFSRIDLKGSHVSSIELHVHTLTLDLFMIWVGMIPLFYTDADFSGDLVMSWVPAAMSGLYMPLLLPEK